LQPSNARKGKKGFISIPIEERFWPRIRKTDGCWIWPGANTGIHSARYQTRGQVWYNGRNITCHRLAWILTHGSIPGDLRVLHKCDTPLCVRPDHLFLGTNTDNSHDCIAKGRAFFQKPRIPGEPFPQNKAEMERSKVRCVHGHPRTPENIIRAKRLNGVQIRCRICEIYRWARYGRKWAVLALKSLSHLTPTTSGAAQEETL